LRTLPPFLVGGWLGAVVVFVGIWFRRRERSTLALLGIALAFPAGYFFFWGNLLSSRAASLSGPVYYVPLYAPACVFVAAVLIAAWRRGRAFAIALCLVLAAVTVPYAASKVDPNHEISAAQEPWKDATDSIDQDALVIVENSGPYLLHLNPYSMNEPGLDGRILYALDRGAENIDAITAHLDRNPYLERTTDPRFDDPVVYHDAPIPRVSLIPLRVLHGNRVTLRVRVKSPSGRAVVAYVDIGNQVEQRTLSTDATPNETFETEWTLVPAGSPAAAQPGALTLTGRLGDVRVGVGSAPSAADALAGRQELEQFSYRVDDQAGTVDMLYPSRKFMGERPKRTIHLTEVDDLRGLDVELTVNH
jgi:hypothetical protein